MLTIPRTFAPEGDPYAGVQFVERPVTGRGAAVRSVIAPESFSQTAVDVLATKFMRRAGVPKYIKRLAEPGVPGVLSRCVAADGNTEFGPETDARQVFNRMAGCWAYFGLRLGYFDADNAIAFYDQMRAVLARQMWAPNSPQWFNTGLYWAYGIEGQDVGQFSIDLRGQLQPDGSERLIDCGIAPSGPAYRRPAANACFILSVADTLLGPGGIYDAVEREARVFKFGGGSGANFSSLREEGAPLAGGGKSSGLMSFLPIFDAGGGAIKSGGVTRRAAKMVVVDIDHPDIEKFIDCKADEEYHAAAMLAGDSVIRSWLADPSADPWTGEAIPEGFRRRALAARGTAAERFLRRPAPYNAHFEGDGSVYAKCGFQNSNNSVRIPAAFMNAKDAGAEWELKRRGDGSTAKTVKAADLWDKLVAAAYTSADPGVQFDTIINDWNPVINDGRIHATNPCGEYHFLDDTACNLGSIKLTVFSRPGEPFDVDRYTAVARLATVVLDITVSMGAYPSEEIAAGSRNYRTLGLGYCDLGALLMRLGIAYDSPAGFAWTAALTSLMHSAATSASAELAGWLGTYPRFAANRPHAERVLRNHYRWACRVAGEKPDPYEGLSVEPPDVDHTLLPEYLRDQVKRSAMIATEKAMIYGQRNAQLDLIAPTGTIGLYLDCDTTGIEPDFALVKVKKLVGGGYMKLVNGSLPAGLEALGYSATEAEDVVRYVFGTRKVPDECAELLNATAGFDADRLDRLVAALTLADSLEAAVASVLTVEEWAAVFGPDYDEELAAVARGGRFRPLASLLVRRGDRLEDAVKTADEWETEVIGSGTVEGAPHLLVSHYPVFDTAVKPARGVRAIHASGHIYLQAAAQPALSGGISKTINLPADATPEDVSKVYDLCYRTGAKSTTVYIDGQKLSQPLNSAHGFDPNDFGGVLLGEPERKTGADADAAEFAGESDWLHGPENPDPEFGSDGADGEVAPPIVRRKLPGRRVGYTQKLRVGQHPFYLRTGEYPDGKLGEIFIDTAKEGAAFRALGNALAVAVSLGLQHGVPLDEYVDAFVGSKFEPHGPVVGHDRIKMASSFLDAIFRDLGISYLGRAELASVQDAPPPGPGVSVGFGYGAGTPGTQAAPEPPEPPPARAFNRFPKPARTPGAAAAVDPTPQPVETVRRPGYSGDACPKCRNFSLRKTGSCVVCDECFFNSGCG